MDLRTLSVPIVLAPMAGSGTPSLAAAVANAGGLGLLPHAYLAPERMRAEIAEMRARTERPFGINLFVDGPLAEPGDALTRAHERLRAYREELGIPHPAEPPRPPEQFEAQIDALIEARPAVATFTFGIPEPRVMQRLRAAGILTIGTATTVEEAIANERAGMDAVCVQGSEAGAHRGTFLRPVAESLVGTIALVPQAIDTVRIPVIAAGGIGDGRGIAAVLALGAIAAQIGTAFLRSDEAATPDAYRRVLASPRVHDTELTTAFSGRSARGVVNRMMRELDPHDIAPYPFQNALTRDIRTAAGKAGEPEFLSLWAGQAASLARAEPAAGIVARLMAEARQAAEGASFRLT